MSKFVTAALIEQVSTETGIGPVAVRDILLAAEVRLADAVLSDLDSSFKMAAVEAGLNTLLLHHFSQIIGNYRKAVSGSAEPDSGS